ncbi:amino acid adenylation domain-containing protein [Clostridium butyricum]
MIKKYPLTPIQHKMYMYNKLYPNDPSYNMHAFLRLTGKLDVEKLIAAVEKVYNEYEIFKINIVSEDKPYQLYDSKRNYNPVVIDIEKFKSDEEKVNYVMNDVNKKANEVIDTSNWPLYNVYIYTSSSINYIYFKYHHIVVDAYSGFIIADKISSAYNEQQFNREENITYFDLENFKMPEKRYNKAIEYFKEEISGEDTLAIKKINVERDKYGNIPSKNINYEIDNKIIKELCKKTNSSEFQVFLSIYIIMIRNLISEDKFIVGIPVANRTKEFKDVLGAFINTLPLKIDFAQIKDFTQLINVVKLKMGKILRYQKFDLAYSLDLLCDKKNKPKDLMNNFFTYYKQPMQLNLDGIKVESCEIKEDYNNAALSIVVEDLEDKCVMHVRYSEQFSKIDFGCIFRNIISQISDDTNININHISLLDKHEQTEMLKKVNRHKIDDLKIKFTIIDKIEEIAAKYPEKTALKYLDKSITFNELNIITNQIARKLITEFDEKYIVLSMEASIELVLMIISIFKSGKTYIPIDNTMPIERKKIILEQIEHPIVFTESSYKEIFNEYNVTCVDVNDWIVEANKQKKDNINEAHLHSVAYIFFTSGSTGIPKGVMVEHKNISCLYESVKRDMKFSTDCRWILFHSYGFDYSIFEMIGSLAFGGRLVIVPTRIRKFTDEFRKFLIKEKINVLTQTPSSFTNLVRVESKQKEHFFKNLKYVMVGAESINFSQLKPWTDIYGFSEPEIYNLYGVTEAAVVSTYHKITQEDIDNENSNIIGKVLTGTDVYIGDKYGNMLPYGVEGELYISGESVGRGYFNNQIQTDKRFNIKNIINSNTRVFKTGDLVKINDNNDLVYLTRIDNQVQISGHRVEIDEIKKTINSYYKCSDSIIISHEFGKNDIRLIGYYILKDNEKCTSDELLNYLKKKLQNYMIPSFLVEINEKPITVNGKIDFKNLPIPSIEIMDDDLNNKDELLLDEKVLNIWKRVLKNKNILIDDNFFDVGGTSVLIVEVYYELLKTFNLSEKDLSMIDLFDYSTPKEIGKFLENLL